MKNCFENCLRYVFLNEGIKSRNSKLVKFEIESKEEISKIEIYKVEIKTKKAHLRFEIFENKT